MVRGGIGLLEFELIRTIVDHFIKAFAFGEDKRGGL